MVPGTLDGQAVCAEPWTLEETLRIGSLDGDDALAGASAMAISPAGEIYVPQPMLGSVYVFSPEGRFVRSFGREGRGPGDFENGPREIAWIRDTLWVADRFRAQSFAPDGRPVDFVTFQHSVPSESAMYRPGLPLSDGTFWGRRSLHFDTRAAGNGLPTSQMAVRRFAPTGEILDTIALIDIENSFIAIRGGGITSHPLWGMMPSGNLGALQRTLTADRSALVFVGQVNETPGSASFDLLRISISGDTLLKRAIPYDPIRISRSEESWWRNEFGALIAEDSVQGQPMVRRLSEATRNRMREQGRESYWSPEYYPPVRQILAGADDTIWLLREFSIPDRVDRWEVYDIEGNLIGRLHDAGHARFVPWRSRLQILRVSRDEVWGTTTDEFDVPYIHRFRVVGSCGDGV